MSRWPTANINFLLKQINSTGKDVGVLYPAYFNKYRTRHEEEEEEEEEEEGGKEKEEEDNSVYFCKRLFVSFKQ